MDLGKLDGCITTYSGIKFSLIDPKPENVRIEDIGKGLSYKGHFSGQTPKFFSIAQHSVLVHDLIPKRARNKNPEIAMLALLHDASEAYIGDMVKPLKVLLPEFQKIENRLQSVILHSFGIEEELMNYVKPYDIQAQEIEYNFFYNNRASNGIFYQSPEDSYKEFIEKYNKVLKQLVKL
jgi:5'-deoxynucleotidase YfbR-like HD superfamily hydrolase